MVVVLLLVINHKLSTAIEINCTFKDFYYDEVGGDLYYCRVDVVVFDEQNRDEITTVSGNHAIAKGNHDVEGLQIVNKKLKTFPTNIQDFFPNIKHLPVNLISNITNSHLISLPKLQYLDFYSNKITSLDSNLFSGLESLKIVRLSYNNIRHVGHDLILPRNCRIFLLNNPCIHANAITEDEITSLETMLQRQCPPADTQSV